MQIRILKTGVVIIVVAAILVLVSNAPGRYPDRSAGTSAAAQRVPAITAESNQRPENGEHDLRLLEMALNRKPGHTPVLMNLARIEEGKGQFGEAKKHLMEVIDREPGNLEARLELGRTLFQAGDVQGALHQTRAILEIKPDHPDALYNLGAIYGNLGNPVLAREYWQRLINLAPQTESGRRAQRMLPQLAGVAR